MLGHGPLSVLLLCLVIGATAAAQSQTLPNGLMTTQGSGATSFPQNNTNDHRWQWHYDSGEFQATGPVTISEIWVRANANSAVNAFSFPSFTVTLASSPTHYALNGVGGTAGHDTVFANNLNGDATVVRSGAWSNPAVGASPGTGTWIPFGLTTPFVYDPTVGDDFIIQIEKCGTTSTWGTTMDGESGPAGANGGNRYGSTSSCTATSHSFNNNEFVPIVKIDYVMGGLAANFTASPDNGAAPLTVQFTDTSTTDDPGGLQSWAWDFDNNGSVDSTAQNPSHTYPPGLYTVSLTVTDLVNGSATRTYPALIDVGPYEFVVTTTGGGVGDVTATAPPAPSGLIEGYTLASLDPAFVVGGGAFLGLNLDPFVISIINTPAAIGNPLHFIPAAGFYPAVPFNAPAGYLSALAGMPIDLTIVWITTTGISQSNVVRIVP